MLDILSSCKYELTSCAVDDEFWTLLVDMFPYLVPALKIFIAPVTEGMTNLMGIEFTIGTYFTASLTFDQQFFK